MKIKELITKLQEFDQELEVLVDGYEGGCDTPSSIDKIEIKKNYRLPNYCGSHEELLEYEREEWHGGYQEWIDNGGIISQAIIIRR